MTHEPNVMCGKPCNRGMRVTVATIVGLIASGKSSDRILEAYPLLVDADFDAAIEYAVWRMEVSIYPT